MEVVLRIFIAFKNPSFSARFEAANLGSNCKHAITRPLRATNSQNNAQLYEARSSSKTTFKKQVPSTQETRVSSATINWFLQFREIMAVYCDNHMPLMHSALKG
jgi:hypothetical protein